MKETGESKFHKSYLTNHYDAHSTCKMQEEYEQL